jgi:hypothetical protein
LPRASTSAIAFTCSTQSSSVGQASIGSIAERKQPSNTPPWIESTRWRVPMNSPPAGSRP